MNPQKRLNFISAVIATVASMLFALLGQGLLRTLFAMPLVVVLPGYAVMAAWFPKRLIKYPGNALFVITLSISITCLAGLGLHLTPWGINTHTWVAALGGIVLINLVIALFWGDFSFSYPVSRAPKLPLYQGMLIACAVIISFLALELGREGARQQYTADITHMWMLPGESNDSMQMGVKNLDDETVSYKLVIRDGTSVIEESFELEPSKTWEKDYNMLVGAKREVFAYLSRLDRPHQVNRSTSLWLPHAE